MRKDFIDEVSRTLKIKRKDLIEKDLILHQILLDLSKDRFFHKNFLFKGGTCLIKHYLGYFRFSEDIDFTWKKQSIFENLSKKETRKTLSKSITEVGELIEGISKKRKLDFQLDKTNTDYVEIGGGGKTATFKIWYNSEILNKKSFVKVQINFVDKMKFNAKKAKLRSLLTKKGEFEFLFPELYKEYSSQIPFFIYDIREIACEKIRAILTRKGIKARDFLDVYLICKRFNLDLKEIKKELIEKTTFVLRKYEKYRKNFEEKKKLVSRDFFEWGEEKNLLLDSIDEKAFYNFLNKLIDFLKETITKIEEEI